MHTGGGNIYDQLVHQQQPAKALALYLGILRANRWTQWNVTVHGNCPVVRVLFSAWYESKMHTMLIQV